MAFFNQEPKAKMAPAIKAVLKKYNLSGSLAVRNHSTVVLNIKSGDIDFISNFNETCGNDRYQIAHGFRPRTDCIDVNPYHYKNHFTGKALNFLEEAFAILNGGNHDNSDIQTDYFDVGWYVDVNIGKWDKPYQLTK